MRDNRAPAAIKKESAEVEYTMTIFNDQYPYSSNAELAKDPEVSSQFLHGNQIFIGSNLYNNQ